MTDTPPEAALFGQIRDALASHRDLAKWQEPLTELARIHYECARRVDVAEADTDAFEARVDHLDKANAQLLNEMEALETENAALRNGVPEEPGPLALFYILEKNVVGLAARMRMAKVEEGGLYCGGCGSNIADNAVGIEPLQTELMELRAFRDKASMLVAEDGCTFSTAVILERLQLTHGMRECHGCRMIVESTMPYDWSNLCPVCWDKAVAEDGDVEAEGVASSDRTTRTHCCTAPIRRASGRLNKVHTGYECLKCRRIVRRDGTGYRGVCDYCDAPFVDGDCKCESTPIDKIPF